MAGREVSTERSIRTIAVNEDAGEVSTLLRALLAVQVADREDRLLGRDPKKTELVLVEAGLSIGEAAHLTNKNYDAVRMAVQRAKARSRAEAENG